MFWFVFWGLSALLFLGMLCLEDIWGWFNDNKQVGADEIGIILKEKLRNGNYKVVAGIFKNRTREIQVNNAWETEELDKSLEDLFDRKNEVIIEI